MVTAILAKIRNTWRALTSMGTALALLFLLALGAVPGALLPQRNLNAAKVDEYLALHPVLGPWLNRLQAFDVFSSFWFTAVYVLLCVSLIGCLTPRTVEQLRSLRAVPVPAPRNLSRLPKYAAAELVGDPVELAATLSHRLRGWRRITRTGDDPAGATAGTVAGAVEVCAEKGYLREFGNLAFHFALLGLLASVAVGRMFGYEGNVMVIADGGAGFCSASPAAFDSFRAGTTVDGTQLQPMCIRVNDFTANYLDSGLATSYTAHIDYQAGDDLAANHWRPYLLEVNHPLRVGGARAYLQGHGYAPTFTVFFRDGQTRTQTVQFRPDNPLTLLSSGALRFDPPAGMYPDPTERRKHQIGIQGLFAPTEQLDDRLLSSAFPAMRDPAVAVDVYRGDTGLDTGRPQGLFTLDSRLIHQGRLPKVARANLKPGQQIRLDDGTVVRFDGAVPFINIQLSHDPAEAWVLVFAIAMMAGLIVSLVVRRRRIWIRITPVPTRPGLSSRAGAHSSPPAGGGTGTVNVEVGGLARTDNSGWGDEFERLCDTMIRSAATGKSDAVTEPGCSPDSASAGRTQ